MGDAPCRSAIAALGRRELILLGGIAALGSLAIQIIVPGLPQLAEGIGASARDGQLVISVYLLVLAASQLVAAPLADRFGRRPLLLFGTALFLLGCVGCALSGNLAAMLVGRTLQAIGSAATLVAARTMATDGAPDGGTAAQLAILTSVILISPAVAPAMGGVIVGLGGWTALFWTMGALALVGLVAALRMVGETRAGDGAPLHVTRIISGYAQVARHPRYLRIALANGFINGGFYLFLAVSPFILAETGATPAMSGLFYSLVASAIILGSLSVPVITRLRPRALMPVGSLFLAAGSVAVIVSALRHAGPIGLLIAMALIAFGAGLTGPSLQAEAIEGQRERASAATSLMGTIQMASAAAISTLVVRVSPSPTISLVVIAGLIAGALLLRGRVA